MQTISAALSASSYPGRGIILGKIADGRYAVAYFIMGRSENSRNRVFVEHGHKGLRTKAFDESKLTDPSLVIYSPVQMFGHTLVVTNGDQTDTVCDYLSAGRTFEEALRARTFEPDPPNYTPRISGLLEPTTDFYKLSILKSGDGNDPEQTRRYFYEYTAPAAGVGHFIHTYQGDGDPLPSFMGEPEPVSLDFESADSFAEAVWNALDKENRVSVFTRLLFDDGSICESKIINKLGDEN